MNEEGEIALGYSISSTTTFPSIGVAGQTKEASGSGILDVGELVVFDGNVGQFVQLGSRWGDYSAMAIDPEDDTFWYTQEYAKPNTRLGQIAGWATKIAQFEFGDDDDDLDKSVAEAETMPDSYALLDNYPNPFNPETQVRFELPEASHVTVRIFNTLGQEIRTLTNKQYEAGSHSVRWDSKDKLGNIVSSGVYLYKVQAGTFTQVKKMTLLK